jgi:acyl carrier protein phosphodiesterase
MHYAFPNTFTIFDSLFFKLISMNFLAHIYLSHDDENLVLGNFIADMVKGKQIEAFSPEIIRGIKLHRKIDHFTDTHEVFGKSKKRLTEKYRHYSGVLVDMFYDHFLAKYWQEYSDEDINDFVKNAYDILLKNYIILPPRAKKILPFMIASNWLVNYADLASLQKRLAGMAKRTTFESGMENAVFDLRENYDLFHQEFKSFFPQLIEFVNFEIKKNRGMLL